MAQLSVDAGLPASVQRRTRTPYFQTVDFLNLAANATDAGKALTIGDEDFVFIGGTRVCTTAADQTVSVFPPIVLTLTPSSSQNILMSGATHVESLFGTAQFPAIWPVAFLLSGKSSLKIVPSNLGGVILNLRLTFWGYKLGPQ